MNYELIIPFLSYAIVTTITPGPNNITAASAGIQLSYKKSIPYILGISSGFFIVMLISGSFTSYILNQYNGLFKIVKWFGATYILYLALNPFLKTKNKKTMKNKTNFSYFTGFGLQIINPKVILYGATIYTSFVSLIGETFLKILISSLFLSFIAFICVSLWALIGNTLSKYLENKIFYYSFNSSIALSLIYIAATIIQNE